MLPERSVPLERSTKQSWLDGPGDLKEAEVHDVPEKGRSVKVRGLPAAYSNEAQSEATKLVTQGREQIATIDTAVLEVLQFQHGVVEPQFTRQDAEVVARKYGPAFKKVIAKIDELSGVDKEAIEQTQARFPTGGEGTSGADLADANGTGDGGSDLPVPVGAKARDARG